MELGRPLQCFVLKIDSGKIVVYYIHWVGILLITRLGETNKRGKSLCLKRSSTLVFIISVRLVRHLFSISSSRLALNPRNVGL